jgi:hypothetical protein
MFTVENSICIPAPLPRVWRAISEVERFRQWHLLVVLTADETDPRKLSIGHRKFGFRSDGEVVRSEFQSAFAWRVKLGRLFEWEEEFQLERGAHGTQLVHKVHMRGLLSVAASIVSKTGMKRSLINIDASLARYLARSLAQKPALSGRRRH